MMCIRIEKVWFTAIVIGLIGSFMCLPSFIFAAEINTILLIDDFDDMTTTNSLDGETQGDEESIGGCIPSFTKNPKQMLGHYGSSLRLEYDVGYQGAFSFYSSRMNAGGKTRDLSAYTYISFWYMAEQPGAHISLEIHKDSDGDGNFFLGKDQISKVSLRKYIEPSLPNLWQKVTIPFKDFYDMKSWDNIFEIVFVFEFSSYGKQGVVYLDDILMGSYYVTPSRSQVITLPDSLRVNLFTVNNNKVDTRFTLAPHNTFDLLLKNLHPLVEKVSIEVSEDGIEDWCTVCKFYDHTTDAYHGTWTITGKKKVFYFIQVVVADIFGNEKIIAGPYGGTYLPVE